MVEFTNPDTPIHPVDQKMAQEMPRLMKLIENFIKGVVGADFAVTIFVAPYGRPGGVQMCSDLPTEVYEDMICFVHSLLHLEKGENTCKVTTVEKEELVIHVEGPATKQ